MDNQTEQEKLPEISSDPESEPAPNAPSDPQVQELAKQYSTEFGPSANERRQPSVFSVEDFSFRSSTPSPTHWSIGWSDLMMTMFILFLTLFVYQATHKKLLISQQTEVVGGETTKAVEVAPKNQATAQFAPIKPSLPIITGGTIKKVIPIHVEDIGANTKFFSEKDKKRLEKAKGTSVTPGATKSPAQRQMQEAGEEAEMGFLVGQEKDHEKSTAEEQKADGNMDKIHRLLARIQDTITRYNLSNYATASLIPGKKAILVILRSDLFFDKERAQLTKNSKKNLQKIGYAIKTAPFMINIIGHTDDRHIQNNRFPSNWELSAARAGAIARFFIEETDMNPNQFEISSFSSYRPLYPNTTAHNRAANRRIDMIISNRYPEPVSAEYQEGR